jgi:hypothetical protein
LHVSKTLISKGDFQMRKIWFMGVGLALFSVAGALYFAGNSNDPSGMRSVKDKEAELIIGGGQQGRAFIWQTVVCGSQGPYPCVASGGYIGANPGYGKVIGTAFCGAEACGSANVLLGPVDE